MKLNELLTEASLGRVFQHWKKHEDDPDYSWAMMTSWRSEEDTETNWRNFNSFKRDVRSMGYGFFELEGHGQEEDGTVSEEPSLFIPKIDLDEALSLAKKYDQFGIVYQGPESDHDVKLFETDGSTMNLGPFRPNKIAQYYSKLRGKRGRPFTFEGVRPTSHIEGMAEQAHQNRLGESSMMKDGGWISPRGEILFSTQTHSHDITADPEMFGFSSEFVEQLYAKHGERFGQEGDAREELITTAIEERNWIRFRRYFRNPARWSFTVGRLDRSTRNRITDFFREAVGSGFNGRQETDMYMDVTIVELKTENVVRGHTVQDIVQFSLLESEQEFEHELVLKEWKDVSSKHFY